MREVNKKKYAVGGTSLWVTERYLSHYFPGYFLAGGGGGMTTTPYKPRDRELFHDPGIDGNGVRREITREERLAPHQVAEPKQVRLSLTILSHSTF